MTATRRITGELSGVGVLVLSMLDDDRPVFAAMRAGARGYLLKGADEDELVRAVTAVARGEAIFGLGVAARVLGLFADPAARAVPFPELTASEREVLGELAAGRGNAAIARRLGPSPRTVANHASSIFAKLQVADRAEAIERARRAGLGEA